MSAHGRHRYKMGCRCFTCRLAEAQYAADLAAGIRRKDVNYMPLGPVREHLARLSAKGVGYRRAAELAGVEPKTVRGWLFRHRAMCLKALGEAVLGVDPDVKPRRWPDSTGTVRRIQALGANGWPLAHVAARIGRRRHNLVQIFDRAEVFPRTRALIEGLYDELWDEPPPPSRWVTRARYLARRDGWFPPGAWDDDTIDDPDALPCILPPVEAVDRDLELLVQHLVAGHPVVPTAAARLEVVRRADDRPLGEVAAMARCSTTQVGKLRAQLGLPGRRAAC